MGAKVKPLESTRTFGMWAFVVQDLWRVSLWMHQKKPRRKRKSWMIRWLWNDGTRQFDYMRSYSGACVFASSINLTFLHTHTHRHTHGVFVCACLNCARSLHVLGMNEYQRTKDAQVHAKSAWAWNRFWAWTAQVLSECHTVLVPVHFQDGILY